jgi:hypothetical protein
LSHTDRLNGIIKSSSYYQTKLDAFFTHTIADAKRAMLAKWALDYVLYHPMLILLLIGSTGIFVSVLQYTILDVVSKDAPTILSLMVSETEAAVTDVDQNIQLWINSTNSAINATQLDINHSLLGWIETGSLAVNSTLTQFSAIMTTELNNTFGGTPLDGPISTVMECVIGNKIAEVQKGLSWVYDNAQVSLPRINTNLITTNSTSATSLNSTASSLSSLLETAMLQLFREYKSELHEQLWISIAMIMLWMLLALCGFLYCFHHLKSS